MARLGVSIDHMLDAVGRAWLSLDGLSIGDAFGERFFGPREQAVQRILRRELPDTPWFYTDDTEMALSIMDILQERGAIDQDLLARRFADRVQFNRGYGPGTYSILCGIKQGLDWRTLTQVGFRGMGSLATELPCGSPRSALSFADQSLTVVCDEARRSAEVTHAHAEGIAGGIAVAVAAVLAWRARDAGGPLGAGWIKAVRDNVPSGHTRDGIDEALGFPLDATIGEAARALGNGSGVTAPDTVPLCLWRWRATPAILRKACGRP